MGAAGAVVVVLFVVVAMRRFPEVRWRAGHLTYHTI